MKVNHSTEIKLSIPEYWEEAKVYLSEKDRILQPIIDTFKGESLHSRGDAFETLARSITGQQISVKAADSIWNRMEGALSGISPQAFIEVEDDILKETGLSGRKISYLNGIAEHFVAGKIPYQEWQETDTDEITIKNTLTAIKGIGPWTAEMFMMFYLLKPDILPLADIGLQKGIQKLYGGDEPLTIHEMQAIAEPWRPYRTVATWYLWRSLDPVPVVY